MVAGLRQVRRPAWWVGLALGQAILLASAGCFGTGQGVDREPVAGPVTGAVSPGSVEGSGGRGSPVFDRPRQRLAVEFKVHRYSAPRGSFAEAGGLWKLVVGPLPDAAATLCLGDNGFRAAVGLESDRQPLREFLSRIEDLRSVLDYAHPDAARHIELNLGLCLPEEAVFYFARDGVLRGLDFLDAEAKLRMTFEMRSANLREIWLEVVPEIEEPPGPPQWEITDEGAKQTPQENRRVFHDLAFSARIPEGGFLLLGPGEALHERPLLARPFFLDRSGNNGDEEGMVRESIYVISPMIRVSGG